MSERYLATNFIPDFSPEDAIGFTGHRNRRAKEGELETVHAQYPNKIWVHGGADGFDTQVDKYANAHGIRCTVLKPDYKGHVDHYAPLERNEVIVDVTSMLVACFDGRNYGGTRYTINYAKRLNRSIWYLAWEELPKIELVFRSGI